ncbi:MAG: hypothetical protein ACXQT1_03245, partial [Methermicoccaceae archaeon]
MDIEGYARRALLKGEDEKELVERLSERIMEVKGDRTSQEEAARLSRAVLLEVKNALRAKGQLF